MNLKKKILYAALIVVCMCAVFTLVYLNDYYRADAEAIAAFADSEVKVEALNDSVRSYGPENARAAFIFYPGGKVEYEAYDPLMRACAEHEILCVLVKMPFNLAVLDVDAADGIQGMFPEIEHWYIGGHSLGGSMAASYLSDNADSYDGLILLASYSVAGLGEKDLKVLSIYGSEDKVLNLEKYKDNIANLPENFSEFVIAGGNHSGFAMYGEQDGDGEARLSNVEQILISAKAIAEFIK